MEDEPATKGRREIVLFLSRIEYQGLDRALQDRCTECDVWGSNDLGQRY